MINFKDKKITVMGLGLHGGGVGAARFMAVNVAKVIVTDLKSAADLKESIAALNGLPIKFVLGQHRAEDFSHTDMVIKNPAVPNNAKPLQIARASKVLIETDIGIFFDFCPVPIIGITGTKGKSSTAVLVYEIFKSRNKNVILAGNIRVSVLDKLSKIKKDDLVVLELSSWQLEGLELKKKSPHIAVVTNIMKDHLNRYTDMKEYVEAKKNIFRFQSKNDYLVLNYDDSVVREFAKESRAKIYYFGLNNIDQDNLDGNVGAWRKDDKLVFGPEQKEILSVSDIKLKGEHNIYNILAAITVAKISGVADQTISKAISMFTGLEGRLEIVRELRRSLYVNDTTSTTPEAIIAALKSFPDKNFILIAGGADKNLDYSELADFIINSSNIKHIILLIGTATDKLVKELKTRNYGIEITIMSSMQEAVKQAYELAKENEVVLMSPGAASFGLFKNEFDRGKQFNDVVSSLR